jgi:hypothetical protein
MPNTVTHHLRGAAVILGSIAAGYCLLDGLHIITIAHSAAAAGRDDVDLAFLSIAAAMQPAALGAAGAVLATRFPKCGAAVLLFSGLGLLYLMPGHASLAVYVFVIAALLALLGAFPWRRLKISIDR